MVGKREEFDSERAVSLLQFFLIYTTFPSRLAYRILPGIEIDACEILKGHVNLAFESTRMNRPRLKSLSLLVEENEKEE